MGSGSFAGGMAGLPGMGSGYGAKLYASLRSSSTSLSKKQTEVEKDSIIIRSKIARKADFEEQVSNPLLSHVYKSLFALSGAAFLNKDLHNFFSAAAITEGPGCMKKWVEKVMQRDLQVNESSKSLIRMSLENFVLKALDNDIRAYFNGDAQMILGKLNQKVFKSTSGYFLGEVIKQLTQKQIAGIDKSGEGIVGMAAQKQADKIVGHFQRQFMGSMHPAANGKQITYENLFDIIAYEKDWFKKEFIK
ncbi:MAG TPA: hypothetical protein VM802_06530 [Chitinophaga sp.]|uniref:hypothetical protein n=1 Tax=Chitinophaga sp. TaxID=1869181 RepID=UPI002D1BE83C|nr:hypothetical protein [Chitinophaga sp.]HVI44504.1 hypothetical protein [Chitinophaga sp.]